MDECQTKASSFIRSFFEVEKSDKTSGKKEVASRQQEYKSESKLFGRNLRCVCGRIVRVGRYEEQWMFMEKFRIESFYKWPAAFIDVRQLAKAGFFYTGVSDIVQCAFCGVKVLDWEAEDDPIKEHERWAGCCKFLKNKTKSGNISLKSEQNDNGGGSDSEMERLVPKASCKCVGAGTKSVGQDVVDS